LHQNKDPLLSRNLLGLMSTGASITDCLEVRAPSSSAKCLKFVPYGDMIQDEK